MTYMSDAVFGSLVQAGQRYGLTLERSGNAIRVNTECTDDKIIEMVQAAGFCPILGPRELGNRRFTVAPYSIQTSHDEHKQVIARNREMVAPAMYKAYMDVISKNYTRDGGIFEMGCEKQFTFLEGVLKKLEFTGSQANSKELKPVNFNEYFQKQKDTDEKIQLFFGINAFDTKSEAIRKENFAQMHHLQNKGGKILLIKDLNPCLGFLIERLEKTNPGHAVFPFFYLTSKPSEFRVILVPLKFVEKKVSESEFVEMVNTECNLLTHHRTLSEGQRKLHALQLDHGLKVIDMESYYVEWMTSELEEAGYTCKTYYHAAFEPAPLPKHTDPIKQDLIYKSVTDSGAIRQWAQNDPSLKEWLDKKGLKLPNFPEGYLQHLKQRGAVMTGAEILVIEAEKR